MLNGRRGTIVQFLESQGRYEVCFGADKLAAVRADNLRRCEPGPSVTHAVFAEPEAPKVGSLASLLGIGQSQPQKEAEPKPAAYQPLWERSGSGAAPGGVLTEDQQEVFRQLQVAEEMREAQENELRRQVVKELASAGVFDETMIELAYQEQLEKHKLEKLLRPQNFTQVARRDRDASRSSSGSSSSSSRSRSRSRSQPQNKG